MDGNDFFILIHFPQHLSDSYMVVWCQINPHCVAGTFPRHLRLLLFVFLFLRDGWIP